MGSRLTNYYYYFFEGTHACSVTHAVSDLHAQQAVHLVPGKQISRSHIPLHTLLEVIKLHITAAFNSCFTHAGGGTHDPSDNDVGKRPGTMSAFPDLVNGLYD
ncbi:uncharacterized protein V6R79_020557 [Siganus canaliculatus]